MSTHPSAHELSDLLTGKLSGDSNETVVAHLQKCGACQDTLREMEPECDNFLATLRKAKPGLPAEPRARNATDSQTAHFAAPIAPKQKAASSVNPPSEGLTKEQFLALLQKSGILSGDDFREVLRFADVAAAPDATALARKLVELGRLTTFQAAQLFQGRSRGFVFGEYVVLDWLGAGGMGQVYKARHRRMDRIVALKVLSAAAMKNADSVRRFQREVRAAARLNHTNIVAAYDAGEQEGVHFLVMEFVDGQDLSARLKKTGPLSVRDVVDAILQAARGLAFAHEQGIVHRDIKPANLLLDAKGMVKILDMGLARLDDSLGAADGGLTGSGQVMGTVDYMAPEQAMNTRHATAAADVYGLGCTLYRLLTAQPLFEGETVVEKIVAHREKPIPSLTRIRSETPAALSALFEQMVAKKSEDRPTMSQVVERLGRLNVEETGKSSSPATNARVSEAATEPLRSIYAPLPPQAVPVANAVRMPNPQHLRAATKNTVNSTAGNAMVGGRKQRPPNKAILAAAGAGALLIACGVLVIVRDKDGNETARVQVPDGGAATVITKAVEPSAAVTATAVQPAAIVKPTEPPPTLPETPSESSRELPAASPAEPPAASPTASPAAPTSTEFVVDGELRPHLTLKGHSGALMSLAVRPDGKQLASGSADGSLKLWDPATGQATATLIHDGGTVAAIDYSPDGKCIVSGINKPGSGGLPRALKLWNAETGQELSFRGGSASVLSIDFSPDGKQIVVVGDNAEIRDAQSGDVISRLNNGTSGNMHAAEYSPDGKWIALAKGGTVEIWDTTKHELKTTLRGHTGVVECVAFSPDGKQLASGAFDETIKLWNTATGAETATLRGHEAPVRQVAFSPDGRRLVSAGSDHLLKVWDATTGQAICTLLGPTSPVYGGVFCLNGEFVAGASADFLVRLWKMPPVDAGKGTATPGIIGGASPATGGTVTPKPLTPTVLPDDFALEFDGIDDYVDLSPFATPSEAMTIEAWVINYQPSDGYHGAVLVAAGAEEYLQLYVQGNAAGPTWKSNVEGKGGGYVRTPLPPESALQMTHVAAVWDGAQLHAFVNGIQRSIAPNGPAKSDVGVQRSSIGADLWNSGVRRTPFHGVVNEVRFSRTARYIGPFQPPAARFETDADTLALYHCDEGAGDVLKDSSGNNHHGKVVGAKWVRGDGSPKESPIAVANTPAKTDPSSTTPSAAVAAQKTEEQETVAADPNDPIARKLATAKTTYDKEVEAIKRAVLDSFEKRESAARRASDKVVVDQIALELAAYEKSGALPAVLWATFDPRIDAADRTLLAAYDVAIRDYVKGRKDDAADALTKQADALRQKAGLIPKYVVPAAPKLSPKDMFDLHREVTAWCIAKNAKVVLVAPNGQVGEPQNGQAPATPFAVKEIYLTTPDFGDADLDKIALLGSLTHLDLRGSSVTDDGIVKLARLTNLKFLNVHDRKVTDRGMAAVATMKSLETLDIGWARISDAGLDAVAGLPNLKTVNLFAASVTDQGLRKLARLKNLKSLELKNPQISTVTIQYLEASIPGLRVSR